MLSFLKSFLFATVTSAVAFDKCALKTFNGRVESYFDDFLVKISANDTLQQDVVSRQMLEVFIEEITPHNGTVLFAGDMADGQIPFAISKLAEKGNCLNTHY